MPYQKQCPVCLHTFTAKRAEAKYCCRDCCDIDKTIAPEIRRANLQAAKNRGKDKARRLKAERVGREFIPRPKLTAYQSVLQRSEAHIQYLAELNGKQAFQWWLANKCPPHIRAEYEAADKAKVNARFRERYKRIAASEVARVGAYKRAKKFEGSTV